MGPCNARTSGAPHETGGSFTGNPPGMPPKYEQVDAQLLAWLDSNRAGATTSLAIQALCITDPTTQRHVSRRFTQLEDKGVLKCRLQGTTRVCSVERNPPTTLARKRWQQAAQAAPAPSAGHSSIPADTSHQFEAAGGRIEKLASPWDKPAPCNSVGIVTFSDFLNTLD